MSLEEKVKDVLEDVGRFSSENQRIVFGIVAVVLVISAASAASSIQMQMGMSLYIEEESETWDDWSHLKEEFDEGNNVFVVVESDDLYDPETIRAIDRLDKRYSSVDNVKGVTSLADIVRMGNDGEMPQTEYGVRQSIDRVRNYGSGSADVVDNLVPRNDMTVLLAPYGNVDTLKTGNFMPRRGSDIIYSEFESETQFVETPPGMTVTVTGQPVFENAAFGLMLPEMIMLFAGAFGMIFLVVYLIMRNKIEKGWHVVFPLGMTMAALMTMMGVMGVLGYDFNAIMLGVMPIALGLGIDYGLQIQTRYTEERENGRSPVDAAGMSARTTGRAILLAMGTTVIGLGSLFISSVPPVRQFGVTSASSVLASMLLSVTLLPALLVKFDSRDTTDTPQRSVAAADGGERDGDEDEVDPDPVESFFERFTGDVICHKPKLTLAVVLVLVLGGAWAYPQVEPKQEMMDFWPQNLEAKNDLTFLENNVESPKVMYAVVEGGDVYTPEKFREISEYQRLMSENPNVNSALSPVTKTKMLNGGRLPESQYRLDSSLSRLTKMETLGIEDPDDKPTQMRIAFYVDDVAGEEVRTLIDEFEGNAEMTIKDGDVRITGKPVLNRNVIENVTAGLTPMTLLSFSLGLIFLTITFKSLRVSAILVLGVAASAALLVTGGMFVAGVPWNPLTVTMSSLTLGIGIDYGIHIYERFEEEMIEHGATPFDAIETAIGKLSRPILGSGLTTITGFGVLLLSRFPVLANFGWTTVFAIAFSLFAGFVVLPAVLTVVKVIDSGQRCRI
ncbi:RND family transporter [Halorutilales archaeon Cl-col2-1]